MCYLLNALSSSGYFKSVVAAVRFLLSGLLSSLRWEESLVELCRGIKGRGPALPWLIDHSCSLVLFSAYIQTVLCNCSQIMTQTRS